MGIYGVELGGMSEYFMIGDLLKFIPTIEKVIDKGNIMLISSFVNYVLFL
jgi:hypothetical protein